ncbi:exodeoxyribonuclease VII small subunit [Natranaerofaba carboxydovora]|uniref:exodeoxyribonuclease VII small subunit n=1 Tax=Natranaerofaba carboxydovora TaxID=2742683 RepID=UPI001F12DD33|nr:exodeoxyribonuclease VII small subunit [Natranaerofaba carboxydovora]UMZ73948.1 Exodeoxyribonuclease 7 small subunit [Natranaerofaba carboxydovora]
MSEPKDYKNEVNEDVNEDKNEDNCEELSFEKALENLEKIVKSLESGKLTLDESVEYFQNGIKLTKLCSEKLEKAEQKINVLTQDEDGEISLRPFDIEEDN